MIRVVEPKDYCYYRSRIDVFMGLLSYQESFHLSDEEQKRCTFFIAEEDGDVYGGAVLREISINQLPHRLKNNVLNFMPHQKEVWEGKLFVRNEPLNSLNRNKSSPLFYLSLLEKFLGFGSQKGSNLLFLSVNQVEYLRIQKGGHWPYVAEVNPPSSLDGLFHGVISLRRPQEKVVTKWNGIPRSARCLG